MLVIPFPDLDQWLAMIGPAPLTTELNSWYLGNTIFVVFLVGGIAAYGFYTSLAGRSVFADEEELPAAT